MDMLDYLITNARIVDPDSGADFPVFSRLLKKTVFL